MPWCASRWSTTEVTLLVWGSSSRTTVTTYSGCRDQRSINDHAVTFSSALKIPCNHMQHFDEYGVSRLCLRLDSSATMPFLLPACKFCKTDSTNSTVPMAGGLVLSARARGTFAASRWKECGRWWCRRDAWRRCQPSALSAHGSVVAPVGHRLWLAVQLSMARHRSAMEIKRGRPRSPAGGQMQTRS